MKCIRIPLQYEVYSYHTFEAEIKDGKFLIWNVKYNPELGGYYIYTDYGYWTMTPLKLLVVLDKEKGLIETLLDRDFSKQYQLVR